MTRTSTPFLFAFALGLAATAAQAGQVTSVVWNVPAQNGIVAYPGGSGTLSGTNSVSYTTAAVIGNGGTPNDVAGTTTAVAWGGVHGTIIPGETPGFGPGLGTSSGTGGTFGETTGSVESISFQSAVTNPVLLLDRTDSNVTSTVTYNLGTLANYAGKLVLLNSNNANFSSGYVNNGPGATLVGTTLSFTNTNNTTQNFDGLALEFIGSYTQLLFQASTTAATDTQTFTIVPNGPSAVPEPSTFAAAGAMTLAGLAYQWRRRKNKVA
jgi:hypothetical protein